MYNMGYQMHAINNRIFFLIGWIVIYHRISDNFGKVEKILTILLFFYIEMINMYVFNVYTIVRKQWNMVNFFTDCFIIFIHSDWYHKDYNNNRF